MKIKFFLLINAVNFKRFVGIFFIIFPFISVGQAPNVSMTIATPTNNTINVCQPAVFHISFPYDGTWMNNPFDLYLNPQLFNQQIPSNPVLVSTETCFGSTTDNPVVTYIDQSNGLSSNTSVIPNGGPNQWAVTITSPPPSLVTFDLIVKVDCSINYASNFVQTWTINKDPDPDPNIIINNQTNNANSFTSNVVFLKFISLNPPQNVTLTEGVDVQLEFIYECVGTTGQVVDIQLLSSPDCAGSVSPYSIVPGSTVYEFSNSSTLLGATASTLTFPAANSSGPNPGFVPITIPAPGQNLKYLHLFLKVRISGCFLECQIEDFSLNYKCSDVTPYPCPYCSYSSLLAQVNLLRCSGCQSLYVKSDVPLAPNTPSSDQSCSNSSTAWEIVISNGTPGTSTNTGTIYKAVVHLTNGSMGAPTGLSLINNDVNLIWDNSSCPTCVLTDINGGTPVSIGNCATPVAAGQSLCNLLVPSPIQSLDFIIENIPPGEFVVLKFNIFKCIEEDNNALLDNAKYFNQWAIDATAYDRCDDITVPLPQSSLPITAYAAPFFGNAHGLSSNSHNSGADIDLALAYTCIIPDIQIPQDQTGVPQPLSPVIPDPNVTYSFKYPGCIELKGAFNSLDDYQIIGGSTGPYHGLLRVNFEPMDGLKINDLINDISLVTSGSSGSYHLPLKYSYKANPTSDCVSDNYYFYYDLNDLTTAGINVIHLLNLGTFNFTLVGCCGSTIVDKNPQFNIRFALLPDPSSFSPLSNCQNISFPTPNNSGKPYCPTSTTECNWLPLSSVNSMIQLHCPGCKSPGIVIESYNLERTTFGSQDPGDQQTSNGTSIAYGDTYWGNTPLDKIRSTHNDELIDRMIARFDDGDYTNGGYTYQWLTTSAGTNAPAFKVLQLTRNIPHSEASEMNLVPLSVDLYVDVPAGSIPSTNTLEDPNYWGANPSDHTLAHYHFGVNDLAQCLVRAGGAGYENQYFFTFNPSTQGAYKVAGLPDAAFYFDLLEPFQQYRLAVTYKVCGSIENNVIGTIPSIITNTMWLSGTAKQFNSVIKPQPNSRADLCSLATPLCFPSYPCPTGTCVPVDQSNLADYYNFYCQTCANTHLFIPENNRVTVGIYDNTQNYISDPCSREVQFNVSSYMHMYSLYLDLFKFEFRTSRFEPKVWHFTMPTGFHLLPYDIGLSSQHDAEISSFYTTNTLSLNTSYKPFDFNLASNSFNNFAFTTTPNPPITCLQSAPAPATEFVYADNQISTRTRFIIESDDCFIGPSPLGPLTGMSVDYDATANCDPSTNGTCATTPINVLNVNAPLYVYPNAPSLIMAANAYTPQTLTAHIPFTITNSGTYIARNVFVILPDQLPCNVSISNISMEYPDGSPVPFSNGVFCIGTLLPTGVQETYYLNLTLNPCCTNNPTSLDLLTGWNCTQCPTDYNAALSACSNNVLTIDINRPLIDVQAVDPVYNPTSLTLCSDIHYSTTFKNTGQGAIVPTTITLSNIPFGVTIVDVIITNLGTGLPSQPGDLIQNGNTFTIPNSVLCAIGFPPVGCVTTNYLTPIWGQDQLIVDVIMSAGCEFANNYANQNFPSPNSNWPNGPDITLTYTDFCNFTTQSIEVFSQNPFPQFDIDDPTNCSECVVIYKSANPPSVTLPGQLVTFTVKVTNASNAIVTADVNDNLPPTYDFTVFSNDLNPPVTGLSLDPYPMSTCSTTYFIAGTFNTEGDCPFPAGTNTAFVSNINGGTAVYNSSVCVDVDWCNTPIDYTAPGPITESDIISNFGGSPTILSKVIQSDFDITISMGNQIYFHNCLIIMGAGARIIMEPSTYMLLDNTVVKSCGIMWSGIEMGSESILWMMNASMLRDANEGINATSNAQFVIRDSEITECVTGITTPYNSGAFHNVFGYVEGTTFGMVHANKLKKMYAGQITSCLNSNCHVETPMAGMFLNNLSMTIGDKMEDPNHFIGLCNGIIGIGSKLTVYNSLFNDVLPNSKNVYSYFNGSGMVSQDGCAIMSLGDRGPSNHVPGDMTLRALPVSTGVTIDNVRYGVFTDFSDLRTFNIVKILSSERGFYCTDNKFLQTTEINFCQINSRLIGIEMEFNEGAAKMQAASNTITISGSLNGQGIVLRDGNTGVLSNYKVVENNITLIDGLNGIFSQATYMPIISNNQITQAPPSGNTLLNTSNGIFVRNCAEAVVSCNEISSNYLNTYVGTIGVSMNSSLKFNMTCNSTTGHNLGFYVGGGCQGSDQNFKGNTMKDNFEGLYLNSMAEMGLQHIRGNQWINYSSPIGAENNNLSNLGASEFSVNFSVQTEYPSIPSGQSAWFVSDPDPSYKCGALCEVRPIGGEAEGGDENSEYLQSVARDSVLTSDYVPEGLNIAQQYLYGEIAVDSILLISDTVLTNFFNNNDGEAIGQLFDVNSTISDGITLSPADVSTIDLTDSLINIKNDSIRIIDSLIIITPDSINLSIRQNLINSLNNLQLTMGNTIAQFNSLSYTVLETASTINAMVLPQELPEDNLKSMNELYLIFRKFGKDTLVSFWTQIWDIAQQCPYAGGSAVSTARNFVALYNDTVVYDDEATCLLSGIYKQGSISNQWSENDVILLPNPADDKIEIAIKIPQESIYRVEIMNTLGAVVQKEIVNVKKQRVTINTNTLAPGVYAAKVILSNTQERIVKFIIQR